MTGDTVGGTQSAYPKLTGPMKTRQQIDHGGDIRHRWARDRQPLPLAIRCGDPAGHHKKWRQTDLPALYGGGSLGVIERAPRPAGTESKEERALLDAKSSRAPLELWR